MSITALKVVNNLYKNVNNVQRGKGDCDVLFQACIISNSAHFGKAHVDRLNTPTENLNHDYSLIAYFS